MWLIKALRAVNVNVWINICHVGKLEFIVDLFWYKMRYNDFLSHTHFQAGEFIIRPFFLYTNLFILDWCVTIVWFESEMHTHTFQTRANDAWSSHIAQQERFSFCGAVGDFFFSSHLILFILLFLAYTRISFTRPLNIPVRVCVELIIIMLSTNLQHLSRQSDGTFSVFVDKNKLKN